MTNLVRGTKCIKIRLSQASKDMHEPLVPMLFPVLDAHISGTEFQYPDLIWKEPTAVNHLIAWIRRCIYLRNELLSMSYQTTCKGFTPLDFAEPASQLLLTRRRTIARPARNRCLLPKGRKNYES